MRPEALSQLLRTLRDPLTQEQPLVLPELPGISPLLLARALYRATLEGRRAKEPPHWLHLDPALVRGQEDEALDLALKLVGEGWLYIGRGPSAGAAAAGRRGGAQHVADEMAARCAGRGPIVLVEGGPPQGLPAPALDWLRAEDALHGVLIDPDLVGQREALTWSLGGSGGVLLTGPPGVGKRSLVRLTHIHHGETPLELLRAQGTSGFSAPGAALLVEEWAQLTDAQRQQVRARLDTGGRWEPPPWQPSRPRPPGFSRSQGESPALAVALCEAALAARSPLPVLILGEPGVGKELLARDLHEASGRSGPCVPSSLSALPPDLVGAELQGIGDGVATSVKAREGLFIAAHTGTLFLDEVGTWSPQIQEQVLRVLSSGEVQRIGEPGRPPRRVDVRVIAATNEDLWARVAQGTFRRDLLDRLTGYVVRLPPLRERGDDILLLARHFLRSALPADRAGAPTQDWAWTVEAEQLLREQRWPGNIRELDGAMGRLAARLVSGAPRPARRLITVELLQEIGLTTPGPTFITQSERPEDEDPLWGLPPPRPTPPGVTRVCVPPFRERSARSRRLAVLAELGGLVATPEVVEQLACGVWRGNHAQLKRALEQLRARGPGLLDLDRLAGELPQLWDGRDPLLVLLAPELLPSGEVQGLSRVLDHDGLLLGRGLRSWRELEELVLPDHTPLAARRQQLRTLVTGGTLACLSIDHVPSLSRPHILVQDLDGELVMTRLVKTYRGVFAGPLAPPMTLSALEEGRPLRLGQGAQLQVRDSRDAVLFQLFLFRGRAAWDALQGGVAAALPAASADQRTRWLTSSQTLPTEPERAGRAAYRPLSAEEAAALAGWLLRWPGVETQHLAPWLRERLAEPPWRGGWLEQYLNHRHCIQYLNRILTYDQAAREALVAHFQAASGRDGVRSRLPQSVARWLPP